MNSVNLGTITIPIIKGEKGDKPVKGVDYWTEADKEEIVNDVETTYNANHEAKMQEYNDNASDKIDDFDGHVSDKTDDFDSHVTSKISEFDTNASNKTTTFNNNATSKTTDFNTNATNKTTTFNDNVTSKTTQFNELVEDKEDEIEAINNTLTPRVEALESGMSNYYKKTETYSKTEIDNKVSSVYRYKGTVSTYADLPVSDLTVGDVYNVETADSTHGIKAGDNVSWNGTTWDKLGGDIDLSAYYTKSETDTLLGDKVNKVQGKGLSTNDYSTEEKNKLSGIESGAEVNVVEVVKVNGTALVPDGNKAVNINISGKEDISNKTDTIDSNSTNTQYAGAKAVYDYVQGIVGDIGDILDELNGTEV